MNELVMVNVVDLRVVMNHRRLVGLNAHVVFGVFLSRKNFFFYFYSINSLCLPST
jgi:hypothetical protein